MLPMVPDNKEKNAYGLMDKIQTYVLAEEQACFFWVAYGMDSLIYSLIYLEKFKRKACTFKLFMVK